MIIPILIVVISIKKSQSADDPFPFALVLITLAIGAALLFGLFVLSRGIISNRDKWIQSFYTKWWIKLGATPPSDLDRNNRRRGYAQRLKVKWNSGVNIRSLTFRGDTGVRVSVDNLTQVIEQLDGQARSDKGYIIDVDALGHGNLIAHEVGRDSLEKNSFESKMSVLSVLKHTLYVTGYDGLPTADLQFNDETSRIMKVNIEGLPKKDHSVATLRRLIDVFGKTFPPLPGHQWVFDIPDSSSVTLERVSNDSDVIRAQKFEKFILNASAAAASSAGIILLGLREVSALDYQGGKPIQFDLMFRDGTFIEGDKLTRYCSKIQKRLVDNAFGHFTIEEYLLSDNLLRFTAQR